MKTKLLLLTTLLLPAPAVAQSATTPVPVQQYATQEQRANAASVTIDDRGNVTQAPNLQDVISMCNTPAALLFDSNNSGRVDSLRVYGVSRISAAIWNLRGPNALGSAATKAELAAEEHAVKFLQGAAISATTRTEFSQTDKEVSAASTTASQSAATSTALSEVRDSLVQIRQSSVQGFIRGGLITGTRTVSLGDGNICVVVRYELPLKQSGRYDSPTGSTSSAPTTSQTPLKNTGYPPLPPGSSGDF
ncbi:hypothetical protein [Deinococcus yavapaiensis]|uniref:LPP20 lipoprotein n=1 Tax=Deinococcus yavapaiensis KR-236 TaxID=694435 RepID=A0A318S2A4_9DEIO|nr:hypothetical protein [Deinococcus yavapaiensis]PYE51967.1 hypothetical protein DES52_11313 [Deinococcus yavapaiensis KR-236]